MAKKLLDQLREELRLKHYSYRTEQAYMDWVRRLSLFNGKRQSGLAITKFSGAVVG